MMSVRFNLTSLNTDEPGPNVKLGNEAEPIDVCLQRGRTECKIETRTAWGWMIGKVEIDKTTGEDARFTLWHGLPRPWTFLANTIGRCIRDQSPGRRDKAMS
jgi:hypothetical protein